MVVFAPGYDYEDYPEGRKSLTIEEMIDAFDQSFRIWHLNIAHQVVKIPDSGFAVLSLLNPYFEMIARHYLGLTSEESKRKTGKLHAEGVKIVFPNLANSPEIAQEVSDLLYDAVRCSVAHMGLTGTGIFLSETRYQHALTVHFDANNKVAMLGIHPPLWVKTISDHFAEYISLLRNPQNQERRNLFSKCFTSPF